MLQTKWIKDRNSCGTAMYSTIWLKIVDGLISMIWFTGVNVMIKQLIRPFKNNSILFKINSYNNKKKKILSFSSLTSSSTINIYEGVLLWIVTGLFSWFMIHSHFPDKIILVSFHNRCDLMRCLSDHGTEHRIIPTNHSLHGSISMWKLMNMIMLFLTDWMMN